jgi:hypothetical protein
MAHSIAVSSVASSVSDQDSGLQISKVARRQSSKKPTPEQLALLGIKLDKQTSPKKLAASDAARRCVTFELAEVAHQSSRSSLSRPPMVVEP